MYQVYTTASLQRFPSLRRSMFSDRRSQFIDRHNWALGCKTNGLECDDFDDCAASYCISSQRNRHYASIRLRDERNGSMVERCFAPLWHSARDRLKNAHEVSRFCAAPHLSPSERQDAVRDVLLGLCRHCIGSGIDRFFGVVYPGVYKTIMRYGWHGEIVLDPTQKGSRRLLLCEWRPSEAIAWALQELQFRDAVSESRTLQDEGHIAHAA